MSAEVSGGRKVRNLLNAYYSLDNTEEGADSKNVDSILRNKKSLAEEQADFCSQNFQAQKWFQSTISNQTIPMLLKVCNELDEDVRTLDSEL